MTVRRETTLSNAYPAHSGHEPRKVAQSRAGRRNGLRSRVARVRRTLQEFAARHEQESRRGVTPQPPEQPAREQPADCPTCHGDGTITTNPAWPDPQGEIDERCPACHGTGLHHQEGP
jgi:predicted CxxxxCH...CXXCH cytochrome family protein